MAGMPHLLAVVATLLAGAADAKAARRNVVLVVSDNLRPALGAYGNVDVKSPAIDAFASDATVFANAHCQIAWCSPSRNSFLSGRRPQATRVYNFVDDFREAGAGAEWTTLPGWFRNEGYYTTSVGKVFHPGLPADFDAAQSWTDEPYWFDKPPCRYRTMCCSLPPTAFAVDVNATDAFVARLRSRPRDRPFFAALGLQSNRLPWSYPAAAAAAYPDAGDIPIAVHRDASGLSDEEYFRPTEVDLYKDIRNVTHDAPMDTGMQHAVRRAYYATVTHVDAMFARVLQVLDEEGVAGDTVVALAADHGQNLGEFNMWSMMSVLDISTQVPLIIRTPGGVGRVYSGPAELVDLMPTLGALAGLPPAPAGWALPGTDLSPALSGGRVEKPAAFSQITRCRDCVRAYANTTAHEQCKYDARADKQYYVPCCMTPRSSFDLMGISVRTAGWRYSMFCRWDGAALTVDVTSCSAHELYDHRNETTRQPLFRPEAELANLAADPSFRDVREALHAQLVEQFGT